MSVTYKNAPLVELITEIRWGAGALAPNPGPQISFHTVGPAAGSDEELYGHFGALMAEQGFGRSERLAPMGISAPPAQATIRYRPTDTKLASPLFQIGQGVLTANALPPYKSWVEFSPKVRLGIDILFNAHTRANLPLPSVQVAVVRYIDAFPDSLTGGRSVRAFLQEVMGIDLVLPKELLSKATNAAQIEQIVQLALPTSAGRMQLSFAEGRNGNERAIMWDASVGVERAFGPDINAVMQALTEERQIIHDMFRALTKPLHNAMGPIQ
jgi:uncharacterized protein (TIGR04255 family)